ncbi:MAG: efflux RND transporter periplasmic adaptor subunit, partial [Gemmataceae bacterium]|nr:efflux RND transporter periplasmic adaptor subunit [Gemmataceae bacterium]
LVDAGEVGRAKAELRQSAAATKNREATLANLRQSGVTADARLREAEAALREAAIRQSAARQALVNLGLAIAESEVAEATDARLEARLHFLGLPPDVAKTLDPKTTPSNLLPLFAPMSGVITSRDVVAGEVVDTARVLFEVVDTAHLWLTLDLPIEDARRVRVGHPVQFKPDGGREEPAGAVVWKSTQADPKTRTVKVRADIPDPTGRFVANTFGTGRVVLREEPKAVLVPSEAVQWDGKCFVVFVRDRESNRKDEKTGLEMKLFHVRCVRVGASTPTHTEVIAGVVPGEWVVFRNADVLRAELFRANLGDGCGH